MTTIQKTGCNRDGITITESLAAIAVAAVGLFAVFAIIPFAARQTEQGLNIDVSVTTGKNGFQEFDVRGMGNISNWRLSYWPGGVIPYPIPQGNDIAPPDPPPAIPPLPQPPHYWSGRPVLIDPLYVNNNFGKISSPALNPEISSFPYPLHHQIPALPDFTIDRINLVSNGQPYNFAHSAEIFQSINELVFDDPVDKLKLPNQRFKFDGGNPVKRFSAGKISWMAMVVPEGSHPHLYRLYVIVFNGRSLNYRTDPGTNLPIDSAGEAVFVATPVNTGVAEGGGDFDFSLIDQTALPNPTLINEMPEDDYLNNGDWVLLTDYQIDPLVTPVPASNWRWYKINRVDPPGKDSKVTARVNLSGPDWTGDIDASTPNLREARAIVVSNVVGVYEKTIRIEYDSIWNE